MPDSPFTPDHLPPCPFRPLPGRVVLADLPTGETTAGGVLLPEIARAPGQRALVVAVGEGVTDLTPGDIAAVRRYDGEWHKLGGVRLRMMDAGDVLGKWINDAEAA